MARTAFKFFWRNFCKDKIVNINLNVNEELVMYLTKERNLEDRKVLTAKVHCLETQLAEKDEEIKLLIRKNSLIKKNLRSQRALEHQKLKDMGHKYEISLSESGKCSSANIVEVNGIANNRPDIFPNKRTARIYNGKHIDENFDVQLDGLRKKTIHVRNHSQYAQYDKMDNNTYTKTDDEYEESFDKESEESRNGQDLFANGAKIVNNIDEYDDNDLVVGDSESKQDDTESNQTDEYERLLKNLAVTPKDDNNEFNLASLCTDYQNDIIKNETALDSFCDTLCKDVELAVEIERGCGGDKQKFGNRILNVQNKPANKKRHKMDEKKKTELLAALKAIDSKGSDDS